MVQNEWNIVLIVGDDEHGGVITTSDVLMVESRNLPVETVTRYIFRIILNTELIPTAAEQAGGV